MNTRLHFSARLILTVVLVVGTGIALTQLERFEPETLRASLAGVGGALFGPLWGTAYNLVGAVLGAMLSFLMPRYLSAECALDRHDGRIKSLIEGVEREGWRFVAVVRLSRGCLTTW